jgi:hypothetical protein
VRSFSAWRVGCLSALAHPRSRRAEIFRCGGPAPLHPPHPALPTPEPPRSPGASPGSLAATTRQCGPERGPSVSAHNRVPDTPPRFRTPGTPWPPETMAAPPAGRNHDPPPKRKRSCSGGGLSLRRCRGWLISPQPAGTPRAHRRRETLAPTESLSQGRGTARDPTLRRTAGSRARSLQAPGAGAPKPADGTGKTNASRSEARRGRPAGQQEINRRATRARGSTPPGRTRGPPGRRRSSPWTRRCGAPSRPTRGGP